MLDLPKRTHARGDNMISWKDDNGMFALMKEKLYTPVVGDILDQMGFRHQFLPAEIRPLVSQVPVQNTGKFCSSTWGVSRV